MGGGTWYVSCASIGLSDNTWGNLTQFVTDGKLYQEYRPFSLEARIRRRRASSTGEFGAWNPVSAYTIREVGCPQLAYSTDFNTITEAGWYYTDGRTMTNAPAHYTYGFLLVVESPADNVRAQVMISGAGSPGAPIYVRRYVGSPRVWETWKASNQ